MEWNNGEKSTATEKTDNTLRRNNTKSQQQKGRKTIHLKEIIQKVNCNREDGQYT